MWEKGSSVRLTPLNITRIRRANATPADSSHFASLPGPKPSAQLNKHAEVVLHDALHADGIRADGSFGQHGGIIYNGNYGKD